MRTISVAGKELAQRVHTGEGGTQLAKRVPQQPRRLCCALPSCRAPQRHAEAVPGECTRTLPMLCNSRLSAGGALVVAAGHLAVGGSRKVREGNGNTPYKTWRAAILHADPLCCGVTRQVCPDAAAAQCGRVQNSAGLRKTHQGAKPLHTVPGAHAISWPPRQKDLQRRQGQ